MKLLLAFGLFPKETQNYVYENSKRDIQSAANALQWSIVHALDSVKINDFSFKIINAMYISSFPKGFKKLFIHTEKFSHLNEQEKNDINLGFCNIILLASSFKYLSLKRQFRRELRKTDEPVKVMFYALTNPFIKLAKYLKTHYKDKVEVIAVSPDLPRYMDTQSIRQAFYKRYIKEKRTMYSYKNLHYIDKFILLTEKMKEDLNAHSYMVMEGIAPEIKPYNEKTTNTKVIIYGGTLNKRYGILDLIDAFNEVCLTEDGIELHVYGYGDAVNDVVRSESVNERIKYFGNVQYDVLQKAISQADILINPRKNDEDFTKYSFPSKTLEYMSYGIPFIGYKLDGIPAEYYSFIFSPENNTNTALADVIKAVAKMTDAERRNYYEKTTCFVDNNKVSNVWGEKIYDFLNS